ncbi:MAG TPA: LysE family translocator [Ignavibacteriaceae bacterium]|nr:LysE family translocator [Ignavibacteriaceae bacterium]
MDGIINLPLFIISSAILIIAPGPDFIYVTSRGISEGHKAGILSALGISVGLLVHTLFAAFGLSAIIRASAAAYIVIKFAGAGYLIYLGIKALLTRTKLNSLEPAGKKGNVFKQGILTNLFNPKAIITFMAFLPQFVDVKMSSHVFQFSFLGLIIALIAVLWFGFVGYFSGIVGSALKKSRFFQNTVSYLSGTVMIALGLRLALKKD